MKRNYFSGFAPVFAFTFSRQIRSRQFIAVTLIFFLLLFGGGAAVVILPQALTDNGEEQITLNRVIFCDATGTTGGADWLKDAGEPFGGLNYEVADSVERAEERADEHTLILLFESDDGAAVFSVITPDNTALGGADTTAFVSYVNSAYRAELIRLSGIDQSLLGELGVPINVEESEVGGDSGDGASGDETSADSLRTIVGGAISYIMIFVMYMMVLLYGQGAAGLVILEKTSKLMDYFLVSVKPAAMILGKVLATCAAAIIQVSALLFGVIAGVRVGVLFSEAILGGVHPTVSGLLDMMSGVSGMFGSGGIILAILVMIAGFVLYCSLAAIGGAMSSKPEDLSSTNMLFTMAIVVSFLLSLYSGGSDGLVSTSEWLIYFPFTAILVTPGRALTGSLTLAQGLVSFALVAATAFVFIIVAGKAYEMMTFYRGDPPKPAKLFTMLRDYMKKKQDI